MLETSDPPIIVCQLETGALVDEFLDDCKSRGLTKNSVDFYAWGLAKLQWWCESLPPSRRKILQVLADEKLGLVSRRDLRRGLDTFFRWCWRVHRVPNCLDDVGRFPKQKRLPRVLTVDQVRLVNQVATGATERAIFLLVMDTGIRLGEIVSLRKADVGPDYLRVNGKVGDRQVPLTPQVRDVLLSLGDAEHVWIGTRGAPMKRDAIKSLLKRLFARAGLTGEKLGAHLLRHTFGTLYVRAGGNVRVLQEIMGHQELATTMLYVHLAARDVAADHVRHSPIQDLSLLSR